MNGHHRMSTAAGKWIFILWVLLLLSPACSFATLTNVVSSNVFEDVYSVDWNYRDDHIAAGLKDNAPGFEICIYRFTNSTLLLRDTHPVTAHCNTVRWSPVSNILAAGSGSMHLSPGNLHLLSFTNQVSLLGITNLAFSEPVRAVAWRSSGTNLVIGMQEASPELWMYRFRTNRLALVTNRDVTVGNQLRIYPNALDWRHNDTRIAAGFGNNIASKEVQIFDFNGTALLDDAQQEITISDMSCVDWSPDGALLAAGASSLTPGYKAFSVYSYNSTAKQLLLQGSTLLNASPLTVDWSPAGDFLAVGTELNSTGPELFLYEYNRLSGALRLLNSNEHISAVNSVRWSSDGKYLAVGDSQNKLTVYRMLFADLSVKKTASTNVVMDGQQFEYNLYVTNRGPDTASSVILTDILSDEVGYVSSTVTVGTASYTNGIVTFDLGDLTNLAVVAASISVTVTPAAAFSIINTCAVQSTTADLVLSNNGAMATVTVVVDTDGDGVLDGADNCPNDFNPPTDWADFTNGWHVAEQADYDLDGVGDACDGCIYSNNPRVAVWHDITGGTNYNSQPDYDLDGVQDACDNCPDDHNPGQNDNDFDLMGDVCDPDDDNDGLPDDWEFLYFGDNLSAVTNVDSDTDGFTNWEEYLAGTHPQNSNLYFRVESMSNLQSRAVYVESETGRIYRLLYADELANPVIWATGQVRAGTGSLLSLTNSTTRTSRFYRVSVSFSP